jgi:hypothetical protein
LLAYIDPGSGTLIIQAIVAGVLGGIFSLGSVLRRRFGLLQRHKAADQDM